MSSVGKYSPRILQLYIKRGYKFSPGANLLPRDYQKLCIGR